MRRFTQEYPVDKFHMFSAWPELFQFHAPTSSVSAALRATALRPWSRNYAHVRIRYCLCDVHFLQPKPWVGQYTTAAVRER